MPNVHLTEIMTRYPQPAVGPVVAAIGPGDRGEFDTAAPEPDILAR